MSETPEVVSDVAKELPPPLPTLFVFDDAEGVDASVWEAVKRMFSGEAK